MTRSGQSLAYLTSVCLCSFRFGCYARCLETQGSPLTCDVAFCAYRLATTRWLPGRCPRLLDATQPPLPTAQTPSQLESSAPGQCQQAQVLHCTPRGCTVVASGQQGPHRDVERRVQLAPLERAPHRLAEVGVSRRRGRPRTKALPPVLETIAAASPHTLQTHACPGPSRPCP